MYTVPYVYASSCTYYNNMYSVRDSHVARIMCADQSAVRRGVYSCADKPDRLMCGI